MNLSPLKLSNRSPRSGAPVPHEHITDTLIEQGLSLPVCSATEEETGAAAIYQAGRDLARQGEWAELDALIKLHDRARDMTQAGTPIAELLSAGARSDLSRALTSFANRRGLSADSDIIRALDTFCEDLHADPLGYGARIVAAEAYMDAGWAWYQQGLISNAPARHIAEFQSNFRKAQDAIHDFSPLEENAPALAATQCSLLAGSADAARDVIDEYEDLIDLNPRAPSHMRAFGLHLLPRWFGNFATLEVQARRIAAQTEKVWGTGGYTWVWLDALAVDPSGFAYLDTGFFLEGIDDVLARRPSQHFINLFAAYLTRYIDDNDDNGSGPDNDQNGGMRRRRSGLVRGRMNELHPWVWANGPMANTAHMIIEDRAQSPAFQKGKRLAQSALAEIYRTELRRIMPAPAPETAEVIL